MVGSLLDSLPMTQSATVSIHWIAVLICLPKITHVDVIGCNCDFALGLQHIQLVQRSNQAKCWFGQISGGGYPNPVSCRKSISTHPCYSAQTERPNTSKITHWEIASQTDRQTDYKHRHADRQTVRQMNRQTDRGSLTSNRRMKSVASSLTLWKCS